VRWGDKVRFIPVATEARRLIHEYLKASEHGEDLEGPLFRPVKNNTTGELRKPLNPKSVYEAQTQQACYQGQYAEMNPFGCKGMGNSLSAGRDTPASILRNSYAVTPHKGIFMLLVPIFLFSTK
jgi:hypothetical protein